MPELYKGDIMKKKKTTMTISYEDSLYTGTLYIVEEDALEKEMDKDNVSLGTEYTSELVAWLEQNRMTVDRIAIQAIDITIMV